MTDLYAATEDSFVYYENSGCNTPNALFDTGILITRAIYDASKVAKPLYEYCVKWVGQLC
mgnify:CR=1 FL=1